MSRKSTVLMILDGYGLNDNCEHSAVCEGRIPVMDQPMSQCPFVKGEANDMAVGLPEGQMSSSEVGHLNMGAGHIVYQKPTRITKSIQDGDFFRIPKFATVVENREKHDSAFHVPELASDGGVHSHNTHIYGPLELVRKNGLEKVHVHCLLDDCNTSPESGKGFMKQLETKMKEIGIGGTASVMRRYYAMSRNKRWDRVKQTYNVLTKGEGDQAESVAAGIQASHDNDKVDEFAIPFVVTRDGKPVATIQDKGSATFYDFCPDRAREATCIFCDDSLDGFPRKKRLDLVYVCFTGYDETIQDKLIVSKKESIINTFGESLVAHKKTQVRIVETEKYAHMTFFFDGGVEKPNEGENRTLAPSPRGIATCDLKPEMSANSVCDKLVEAIRSSRYDVIIINFASPDMVGHIGAGDAVIKATETVGACVGRTVEAVKEVDGVMLICADHGDVERLVDYEAGEPFTTHTTNPAPFILIGADPFYKLHEGGTLCDIAPTLIELMGMEQPKEVIRTSLLIR